MHTKLGFATAVLTAFSVAPVFAQTTTPYGAQIDTTTSLSNIIYVAGAVDVTGSIGIAAEAGAVADNQQSLINNNTISVGGSNVAKIDNGTGNGAKGNIGINIVSGAGNGQGNEAALASLHDASQVFASAQTFSTQTSAANFTLVLFSDNWAKLDHSLNSVTGNIGVNLASGAGNLQSNQLAAASIDHGHGVVAKATGSNDQLIGDNFGFGQAAFTNVAGISHSLRDSTGNIGANAVAGVGNLQHNSLSIASGR